MLTRGPYLRMHTTTKVTVRRRTRAPTDSRESMAASASP